MPWMPNIQNVNTKVPSYIGPDFIKVVEGELSAPRREKEIHVVRQQEEKPAACF